MLIGLFTQSFMSDQLGTQFVSWDALLQANVEANSEEIKPNS